MVDVNKAEKFEDTKTMIHEEVIKCIEEAIKNMPTKCVRTQADIDQFYED